MVVFLNIAHNKREKARNSTLIIQMNGATTEITDPAAPNDPPRKFTFDYSYWSHDGFEKNEEGYLQPAAPNYADQVWGLAFSRLRFPTNGRIYIRRHFKRLQYTNYTSCI